LENLADDLLFMKKFDIDMIGMGPYLEHEDTPLYALRHTLLPKEERFDLTLKMIAILRIIMKDVNIAATTALQAIDPMGREKAMKIGANVIMPTSRPASIAMTTFCTRKNPVQARLPTTVIHALKPA